MNKISQSLSTVKGLETFLKNDEPRQLKNKTICFYYAKGHIISVKYKKDWIKLEFSINGQNFVV